MKQFFYLFLCTIASISYSCEEDATLKERDYPFVVTNEMKRNESEILFSAKILNIGQQEIIEYGFYWSVYEAPTLNGNTISIHSSPIEMEYTIPLLVTLDNGNSYTFQAFIRTDQSLVLGNVREFRYLW